MVRFWYLVPTYVVTEDRCDYFNISDKMIVNNGVVED
jgi:hypothetical protein